MSDNYVTVDVHQGATIEVNDIVLLTPIAYGIYATGNSNYWQRAGCFRAYFSSGFHIAFQGEVDADGVDYCETLEQWYKLVLEGMHKG